MANWNETDPTSQRYRRSTPNKHQSSSFHLHHDLCPCLLSVPLYHWIHFTPRDTRIGFHRHLIDLIWIAPAVEKASKLLFEPTQNTKSVLFRFRSKIERGHGDHYTQGTLLRAQDPLVFTLVHHTKVPKEYLNMSPTYLKLKHHHPRCLFESLDPSTPPTASAISLQTVHFLRIFHTSHAPTVFINQ